jgi:uncharacterized protein (DUF433 family)
MLPTELMLSELSKPDAQAAEPSTTPRGSHWASTYRGSALRGLSAATEWYVQSQVHGLVALRNVVDVDPERRSGIPVLRGTRFTVAQVLAELAETEGVEELAENFDLDVHKIKDLLNGFSLLLNRPFDK